MQITSQQAERWETWIREEQVASYGPEKGWSYDLNWQVSANNRFITNGEDPGSRQDQAWFNDIYSRYQRSVDAGTVVEGASLNQPEVAKSSKKEFIARYISQLGKASNIVHIMGFVSSAVLDVAEITQLDTYKDELFKTMKSRIVGVSADEMLKIYQAELPGLDLFSVGIERAMLGSGREQGVAYIALSDMQEAIADRDNEAFFDAYYPFATLAHTYFIQKSEEIAWAQPGILSHYPAELWDDK